MIDLDSQSCLLRVTSKPPFQSNSSLLCFPGLPAAARHSRLRASSELHLSCARSPTLEGMSGLRSPDQHHRSRLIPIQSLSLSPLFLSLSLSLSVSFAFAFAFPAFSSPPPHLSPALILFVSQDSPRSANAKELNASDLCPCQSPNHHRTPQVRPDQPLFLNRQRATCTQCV